MPTLKPQRARIHEVLRIKRLLDDRNQAIRFGVKPCAIGICATDLEMRGSVFGIQCHQILFDPVDILLHFLIGRIGWHTLKIRCVKQPVMKLGSRIGQ